MKKLKFFIFLIIFLFTSLNLLYSQSNLTVTEKEQVVKEHNKYRSQVGAPDIVWSDNLAAVAQDWANQVADQPQITHSNNSYGENLYWGSTEATPYQVVYLWASEQRYYHGEVIDNSNYMIFGHYTQIVWAETTELGCGKAKSESGRVVWVCNYNPSGNYIGEKPYGNK